MACGDTPMDVEYLEAVFRNEFIDHAPLYVASKKVQLGSEDLRPNIKFVMYRGSLQECGNIVELISDYKMISESEAVLNKMGLDSLFLEHTKTLARNAGVFVDGLIRKENAKERDSTDPRDTKSTIVTDVFQMREGKRNLNLVVVNNPPVQFDPGNPQTLGWVAYRFYFASARLRQEYQATA